MKAMIFAAGLGTRLKPLTDSIPKALVPIAGKPLLEHVIIKLKSAGFNEIIVNVHHFPEQIIDFIRQKDAFGIRIEVSDERELLLETGGGIQKAAWFFDDKQPFLVHNVDILSNIDLKRMYEAHLSKNVLATLVVSKRDTFRYLLFDDNLRLHGWTNLKTKEIKPCELTNVTDYQQLAFAGIQVISPTIFNLMNDFGQRFPIMEFYLSQAGNQTINGFIPSDFEMIDVGKLNVLDEAEKFVLRNCNS